MIKKSYPLMLSVAVVIAVAASCSSPGGAGKTAEKKLRVAVGAPPVAYIVRAIGGGRVDVGVMIKPGQDPHTFEPTPKQIAGVSNCDVYFTADLPFEDQMVPRLKSDNEKMKIVNALESLDTLKEGDRPDPDVWMDTVADERVAEVVHRELLLADPANAATYNAGYEALENKLKALDEEVKAKMLPFRGRKFLTIHPAFGYFAREYGLEQLAIEHEGKDPGSRGLGDVIDIAKADKIKVVFTLPQISEKEANAVAGAAGAKLVSVDPHAENFVETIRQFAGELEKSMK